MLPPSSLSPSAPPSCTRKHPASFLDFHLFPLVIPYHHFPGLLKLLASETTCPYSSFFLFLFPHVSSPQPSEVPCPSSSLPRDSTIHCSHDYDSTKVEVTGGAALLGDGSSVRKYSAAQASLLSPSPLGSLLPAFPSVSVDCGIWVSPQLPRVFTSFPQTVTNPQA